MLYSTMDGAPSWMIDSKSAISKLGDLLYGLCGYFMISMYLIFDFFVIFFTAVEIFGPHEDYGSELLERIAALGLVKKLGHVDTVLFDFQKKPTIVSDETSVDFDRNDGHSGTDPPD